MMITKTQLHADDMRQAVQATIQNTLQLDMNGYRCDTVMVGDVLLKAACEASSIEATCTDLVDVAHSNSIREQLHKHFDVAELGQQESRLNQALAEQIPADMPRGGLEIAMDEHDEPFYGQSELLRTYAVRDRARKGTTRFYRIATAYVIWRQVRLTLAVAYVLPDDNRLSVLQSLLRRVQTLGFHATVLYLDKGFCQGDVIRYLQDDQQAAILACPIRGKTGGTRALCQGRKSYRTAYTFADGTEVNMALVATLPKTKLGRRQRKWLAYVVIGLEAWTPQQIKRNYRRRFGIECNYRQLRRLRLHSNTRNPALRFFALGFGLLLINIWATLRWRYCRVVGRGRPRMDTTRLRLQQFSQMLRRSVEVVYGVVMAVDILSPTQSVVY